MSSPLSRKYRDSCRSHKHKHTPTPTHPRTHAKKKQCHEQKKTGGARAFFAPTTTTDTTLQLFVPHLSLSCCHSSLCPYFQKKEDESQQPACRPRQTRGRLAPVPRAACPRRGSRRRTARPGRRGPGCANGTLVCRSRVGRCRKTRATAAARAHERSPNFVGGRIGLCLPVRSCRWLRLFLLLRGKLGAVFSLSAQLCSKT